MSKVTERIYSRLPVSLQNAAVGIVGYRWHRRRLGGVFEKELQGFKEREGFTAEQWRAYQTTRLRHLLTHAFNTVPYYRRVYSAGGFGVDDLGRFELEDLKRLPFLEKEDLRRLGRTELLSSRPERGGEFYASSGSSGTPTSIRYSHAFHQRWSAAFEARIRHWAGLDRHQPRGTIGGRRIVPVGNAKPPYYRYNWVERQTYLSAYHISPATVPNYLEGMKKHAVEYMTGYAMANYFLASMLRDRGLDGPPLRAVITSSEKLTQAMRDAFRNTYGCQTFDSYSGVEACGLISENEHGELVVSPDVGVLEVLDSDGNDVGPGGTGEVVSTGLLNCDQPLIRYRIGDVVTLAAEQRSLSGRAMPLIRDIGGRLEDSVVGPDGRMMVRFHGLFVEVPHLRAAQVLQESLNQITIRVVTDAGFSRNEERVIADRLRSQLGDVNVTILRVNELPRNANGKVQAVVSMVKSS